MYNYLHYIENDDNTINFELIKHTLFCFFIFIFLIIMVYYFVILFNKV
jgi:hypothetical protein